MKDIPPPAGAFGALIQELQRAVTAEGYARPTPIQERCIRPLLEGRDLVGTAQTGTGKTAAFALPLLQRLHLDPRPAAKGTPRALVLAPTRELAAQIDESVATYGRFLDLGHAVVFGGVNQARQVAALRRGPAVLVATPGRLLDLVGQGHIHLEKAGIFVLDEVDRMLDMGFLPDIGRVLSCVPAARQTLFFSATMPAKMEALAGTMVRDPVRVDVSPGKPVVEGVRQKVLFVGKRDKDALLAGLLQKRGIGKALVFTQMKHMANRVVKKLDAAGVAGAALHGNKSQAARTRALEGFKNGRFRVLVATDVAARGLDVDDITHVINYDLPVEAETYVHRIGRTARAGAGGEALSFCCAEERCYLTEIERLLRRPIPAGRDHPFHSEEASRSTLPAPAPRNHGSGREKGGAGRRRNRGSARRETGGGVAGPGHDRGRRRGRGRPRARRG